MIKNNKIELNNININITTKDRSHDDISPQILITIKQGDKEFIEKTSYETLSNFIHSQYDKDEVEILCQFKLNSGSEGIDPSSSGLEPVALPLNYEPIFGAG